MTAPRVVQQKEPPDFRSRVHVDENFPARKILTKEQKPYEEGSILMNAPEHTMEELAEIALDKQRWKRGANAIKHGSEQQHWRAFLIQHETQ